MVHPVASPVCQSTILAASPACGLKGRHRQDPIESLLGVLRVVSDVPTEPCCTLRRCCSVRHDGPTRQTSRLDSGANIDPELTFRACGPRNGMGPKRPINGQHLPRSRVVAGLGLAMFFTSIASASFDQLQGQRVCTSSSQGLDDFVIGAATKLSMSCFLASKRCHLSVGLSTVQSELQFHTLLG